MTLTVKYSVFAVISTVLNIFSQYISLTVYKGAYDLYLAILIGTLVGLLVKYILDKKYIFYYNAIDYRDDLKKFILYSFMGIFTTLIFWGFELWFNFTFDFESAKFIGAVVGLSIGYFVKYHLDKRWVFIKNNKNN